MSNIEQDPGGNGNSLDIATQLGLLVGSPCQGVNPGSLLTFDDIVLLV